MMSTTTTINKQRLYFNGDSSQFKVWETRFTNYLYTLDKSIYKALMPKVNGVNDDADFDDKNRRAYAELVQVLDEKSMMMIINDNSNDGRQAFKTLRAHYASTEKPRVLTLYEELTTLQMSDSEDITDYIIRAETAATGLRAAEETISDNLVIAMILKGLPPMYKPFTVVHTQLDKYKTLVDFKAALVNFSNTENMSSTPSQSCVMASKHNTGEYVNKGKNNKFQCLSCSQFGHKSRDCELKADLFCNFCRNSGHVESVCFKKKKHKKPSKSSTSGAHSSSVSSNYSFTLNAFPETDSVNHCKTGKFLVDCGATSHIVNDRAFFQTFDKNFKPECHFIELANGQRSNEFAKAMGTAVFTVTDSNGKECTFTLNNALYVPQFPVNLFSVRVATDAGAKFIFSKNKATLTHHKAVFNIVRHGNLYFLPTTMSTRTYLTKTLLEWHHTLGHMNFEDILKLQEVCDGMKVTNSNQKSCVTCDLNKMSRQPKLKDIHTIKATYPLQRVHTDMCGEITPTAKGGFKYIVNFVDEYSSMLFVYFTHTKDEAHNALKHFLSDVSPIGKVKEIHSDNGGEYIGQEFQKVLLDNNIKHTTTAPHSPYQNGKSERSWRSLLDMARCLRQDSNIPKCFWPYTVRHAQYLRNRSYQRRTNMTAYEQFCGNKPDMRHLYTFGSQCTYRVEGHRNKFDHKGKTGTYLGINPKSNGYYVLTDNNRVITSRNVVVYESSVSDNDEEIQIIQPVTDAGSTDDAHNETGDVDDSHSTTSESETDDSHSTTRQSETEDSHSDSNNDSTTVKSPPKRVVPPRERKPPKYLQDYVTSAVHIDKAYSVIIHNRVNKGVTKTTSKDERHRSTFSIY